MGLSAAILFVFTPPPYLHSSSASKLIIPISKILPSPARGARRGWMWLWRWTWNFINSTPAAASPGRSSFERRRYVLNKIPEDPIKMWEGERAQWRDGGTTCVFTSACTGRRTQNGINKVCIEFLLFIVCFMFSLSLARSLASHPQLFPRKM
jgi:hypothetical protein